MYLVVIAWLYVTVMMALAEATSSTGSILGAIITFALYGLLPLSIVVYILGTPGRRRAIHAQEMAERAQEAAARATATSAAIIMAPNTSGHAPTGAEGSSVTPVGKEP